jgi:hypothetical protein
MSYLRFKLTNTSVRTAAEVMAGTLATITPNYFVSSLTERMEIYAGSILLEHVHSYGLLHAMWTDMIGCANAHLSTKNVMKGMEPLPG